MNILTHVKMEMLANGRGSGTSADQARAADKARVMDLVTKEDINPQAVERGIQLIMRSVKEAAGWTRDLFLLVRSCSDIHIAKASLVAAESRAVQRFRELITQEDKEYAGKIKNLNDIAKYNGQTQLTYSVTKSKIFGIIDSNVDLCHDLQSLWLFQTKHDGAPHKGLPDGFLDPWHARYQDDKKGSTLFMRDAREAQAAKGILTAREAQLNREKSKEASAQTGQNGEQTQQQVTSGGTASVVQKGDLVKSTQEALNLVVRLTMACNSDQEVTIEDTNRVLTECANGLQKLITDARDKVKQAVAATSSSPSKGIAAAKAAADGIPSEVPADGSSAVEQTPGGSSPVMASVRPEWIVEDQWMIMTEEERALALDSGQKAWEEEAALMERANEEKDAGSNEPKAQNG